MMYSSAVKNATFAGARRHFEKYNCKKCEGCILLAMRPRGEEEIEEKEGGDARRSTKNRRLKCVWCNYTSFAAHKTFIFVAR